MDRRFYHRIVWMIVFLVLFGLYSRLLGQHAITAFVAPALAGVTCLVLAYAYRAFVQRRG
jgi:uncharacterized membrane protein